MSEAIRGVAAGIAAGCAVLCASPAGADTLTAKCAGVDAGKPYEMTLVYKGDDSGTLTVSGSFGDMSLNAAKRERDSVVEGEKIHATQFWGGGEVPLIVPDKAAIEACIKRKLPPEQVTDGDIVFVTLPSCAAAAPPTAEPIPVKVYAELTFLDPETVYLTFKRTYLEKTDLPDGEIVLEPLPPPNCTMKYETRFTGSRLDASSPGLTQRSRAAYSVAMSSLVQKKFGEAAADYAASPVHAEGPSLARLLELVETKPTWRLLDIATGAGHTALAFAPKLAKVTASDITPEMLGEARSSRKRGA